MKSNKDFKHYTLEQLITVASDSFCWSDVCRGVGITVCTYNINRLKVLCDKYDVSTEHFDVKKTFKRNKFSHTEESFFVENCTAPRSSARQISIRLGFYRNHCDECGIPDTWNGKPLTLELEHVNGISNDNRKENLSWLCPNCHSQTSTYRRRRTERSE
ncbi:HNH endonuclease [Vibrio phage D479]